MSPSSILRGEYTSYFFNGVRSHLFVVKVCIRSSRSRNKFILSKCGRHLNLVHSSLEVSSICYLKLVVHSGNKREDLI